MPKKAVFVFQNAIATKGSADEKTFHRAAQKCKIMPCFPSFS